MNYEKFKNFTQNQLLNYTWEKEGNRILSNNKNETHLNISEKRTLKFLISKSSPDFKNRKKLWLVSSGAKKEMKNNPNYFRNLVKISKNFKSLSYHQIEVDLNRTFPLEPFYQINENINRLKNILICYSIRNSSIGYCQGFNFIVGRLLMYLDNEEETFWIFSQLIEHLLPINFYSELVGIITDCSILINFIEKYLPDLFAYLKNNNLELGITNFIHKWFVSLFAQNFSSEVNLIIWDFLFLEGNMVMFKAALGILKILKNEIMSSPNFVLSNRTKELSGIPNVYTDLIFYLAFRRFEFDMKFIENLRKNILIPIVENIIMENKHSLKIKEKHKKDTSQVNKTIEFNSNSSNSFEKIQQNAEIENICNLESPICIVDIENNFQHSIISFLAYRIKNYPPKIIDNYYSKKNHNNLRNLSNLHNATSTPIDKKSSFKRRTYSRHEFNIFNYEEYFKEFNIGEDNLSSNEPYDDILIERHSHLCHKLSFTNEKNINDNIKRKKNSGNIYKKIDNEKNSENAETSQDEIMKIYSIIKNDKNFDSINTYCFKQFTPKPFEF